MPAAESAQQPSPPTTQAAVEPAQTPAVTGSPAPQAEIDRRAKTFADFFNGQVLDIDIESQSIQPDGNN